MTANASSPLPDPDSSAGLWLDVHIRGGRSYSLSLDQFPVYIGGADGCHLRIPGHQIPDVLGLIDVAGSSLVFHPKSDSAVILLNSQSISGPEAVPLHPGDRLSLGPADVTLRGTAIPAVRPKLYQPETPVAYLHPKLVREERGTGWDNTRSGDFTIPRESPLEPAAAPVADFEIDLDAFHRQLRARSQELDERAAELETDRQLWYRRKQELEKDVEARSQIERIEQVRQKEADLTTRELDLARARDELSTLRQSLYDQYRERRDQLAEFQEQLRTQSANLIERERQVLEREAEAEARLREARQLAQETASYESRVLDLRRREEQFDAAWREMERQRQSVDELRAELTRDRDTFTSERSLYESRWQEREQNVTAREDAVTRRDEDLTRKTEQLAADRAQLVQALAAVETRNREFEQREQQIERRAAEVDSRYQQLTRDTAELEEHVRRLTDEQKRLQSEFEVLDRQRREFDQRDAAFAERIAAHESQQASLAVLEASLTRRLEDVQATEATAARDWANLGRAQAEFADRLRESERLRHELSTMRLSADAERRSLAEQHSLHQAELEELQRQRDLATRESARLAAWQAELDVRSHEIAEQTAVLKARVQQVMDLQERLEADRQAVRFRESTLGESESARLQLQDHLRRRAEELSQRAKELDDLALRISERQQEVENFRTTMDAERERWLEAVRQRDEELVQLRAEIDRRDAGLAEREAALARQVERLRSVGQSVAADRKGLFEHRQQWERDQARLIAEQTEQTQRLRQYHQELTARIDELRKQAPELEQQAQQAMERVAQARDLLRGHLRELHAFSDHGRGEYEQIRGGIQAESDRLHERELAIDKARSEHRLAVAAFRQQLVDWQGQVTGLKQALAQHEAKMATRAAETQAAVSSVEWQSKELARQAEELQEARRQVDVRRAEVERHLAEMREWYRKKLRELAASKAQDAAVPPNHELDPGDRQLGNVLRKYDLIDAETLQKLWAEAARQRRTLRQVLLSSGTITLYQLALIEAGNLDGLAIGRFRVIDRIRTSPRELAFRVFDPQRAAEPNRGVVLLRMLSDSELQDAVHPDEFRQRFAALAAASHPNLGNTLELLELNGRPAVVQEWVGGLPSGDWPMLLPGVWLKLLTDTASGLAALHHAGLPHGRLSDEAIHLTPVGLVKVINGALPAWLTPPSDRPADDFAGDLRTLGEIAADWANKVTAEGRKSRKPKPFPDPLLAMLRRLQAGTTFPMADEVARAEPYPDIDHLLVDLHRLSSAYPCSSSEWAKLLDAVSEPKPDAAAPRKAG